MEVSTEQLADLRRDLPSPTLSSSNQLSSRTMLLVAAGAALILSVAGIFIWLMLASVNEENAVTASQPSSNSGGALRCDADGSITLGARAARIHGNGARYERNSNNIGFWTNPDDFLSWQVELAAEQTYEVVLTWSCEGDGEGTRCVFQIGDEKVAIVIRGTGAWHLYQTEGVGSIRLAAGQYQATMRVVFKATPGHAALNSRSIRLVPRARDASTSG